MSEKKSNDHENHSNEDEDFGLPEVNITPLSEVPKKEARDTVKGAVPPPPVSEPAVHIKKETYEVTEDRKQGKKRSYIILLILLVLLLGIGYGLYHFKVIDWPGTPESEDTVAVEREEEPAAPPADMEIAEEEPEEPEEIKLTEITSKIDVPRYFVVVGSFIDDDLARDYSEKLNKMGKNTFLIHPYGDIAFYRLSVGQFENLDSALATIDEVRSDFEENLWVLKY
ncbi:SPOR domain-containing protein [Negadavirga shengliensis]|uniref:SPOR domain-containing protein n=1 Tax=Negadavirga shengliensis TaxID=1389218 RepID=A0ABV9T0B2_9BACT